jgi:site-specific DNA-methyltransferase (adenine-specific)
MENKIFNSDCFDIFTKISNKTVDLVIVDLPYGQTDNAWDVKIDLNKMWQELKRTCKENCIFIFFCTTKFGNELINSNPSWFRYDLIWEKSKMAGFLSANKMPLRKHEMIYIFSGRGEDDLDISRNKLMREYALKVKNYINLSINQINKKLGNRKAEHFFYTDTSQFARPTLETYNKLIEYFKIDKMEGFIKFENLENFEKKEKIETVYNPQKTEGKPYAMAQQSKEIMTNYGIKRLKSVNTTGDRFPTSIQKFNHDDISYHPTQKPILLLEWLIKTYSNEQDLILDFTMGSGSTCIACINTNRRYIGIEKDNEIFKIAEERINKHNKNII